MLGLGPTKIQASKFPLYVSVISDGLLRQSSHGGEKKKGRQSIVKAKIRPPALAYHFTCYHTYPDSPMLFFNLQSSSNAQNDK